MSMLSILDLVPIRAGTDAGQALRDSIELVQAAEQLGYRRYWVAEHHNAPSIASAATSVVIGALAAATSTIRVGAGGIMLPNHAPLMIAEQFGTLASLYPDRIDLGLGRAPGTDGRTARALRRDPTRADAFPEDVRELQALLASPHPGQAIHAVPGEGTEVPLYILGSSLFGAQLAAAMGLPYAFASHFAPDALGEALEVYRSGFRPSAQLERPHAMVALNVIAGQTDAEARHRFTTLQQMLANLVRGTPGLMPPPIDDIDAFWGPVERHHASRMLAVSVVGGRDTVREGLGRVMAATEADELIVVCNAYEPAARRETYAMLAELADEGALEGHARSEPARRSG